MATQGYPREISEAVASAAVEWLIEELETGREVARFQGNLVLTGGIQELVRLFVGTGGTAYSATAARIGVGDSGTEADPGQTGLLGTNKAYKGMNSGYPRIEPDGVKVTFQATFGPSEALFHWREFAVDNGTVAFNRRVQDVGQKTTTSWRVSVMIRFAGAT